ncbi:non-ribosomal peptide synthetase, partial [Brevibacillus laterosporus]
MNKDLIQLFPLTQPQQRIWYSELLYPNTGVSTISLTIKMKGNINLSALQQALNMIICRHDVFRIKITAQNGYPQQYLEEYSDKTFECFDFSGVDREAQALKWLDQHSRTPFELLHSDLYQFVICKISDQEYWYNVKIHHIVCDGISARMFINQANEYYSQIASGQLPEIAENHSYFDFIQTEQDYEESDRYQKDKTYWVDKFSTLPEVIGFKSYNPFTLSTAGKRKNIILEDSLYHNLYEFCKQTKNSMLTVFMTALYIYMHKKTTQNDVSIGTFYANRTTKKEKEMLGMFVSTVPTRVYVDPDMDLSSLLQVVSKEQVSILRHQRFPYNRMMEDLRQTHQHKDLQRLFGASVQYRAMNYSQYENVGIEVDENFCGDVINDFEMNVIELDDHKILFQLNYRAELFTEEEMEQLVQQFFIIIETIIHHPTSKIADISLLREEEKNYILSVCNNTQADYPREKLIHQLFEEQAARTPEQVAVIWEGEQLTYQELNETSNQLAYFLREKGVTADSVVSIMAEHSLELVVGILAILKAGATYLPIDPDYPEDRIQYLLEDSQTTILLTQQKFSTKCTFNKEIFYLDNQELYQGSTANLEHINDMYDLAYIIYTSGSTGNPKGAMITHQGLVNYIWWARKVYVQNETVHFPLYSSISFDLTVTSIFTPLVSGNTIYIYSGEDKVQVIQDILTDNKVGIIKLTPTHLKLIEEFDGTNSNVRRFIVGGESLHTQLASKIDRNFGGNVQIMNEYGPTETVVGCMLYVFDPNNTSQNSVPIGVPADNV